MTRSYHAAVGEREMRGALAALETDRYELSIDPAAPDADGWTDTVDAEDILTLLDRGADDRPPWHLHVRTDDKRTRLSASTYAPSRNGSGAIVSISAAPSAPYDAVVEQFRDRAHV